MTLEEAIKHCEEKACGNTECAAEHKQLAEWLKELQAMKSLPSNLDEAAREKAREIFDAHEKYDIGEEKNRILLGLLELETFAMMFYDNGAEWMAEQGVTYHGVISADKTIPVLPMKDVSDMGLDYGDKVIVQILKIDWYGTR